MQESIPPMRLVKYSKTFLACSSVVGGLESKVAVTIEAAGCRAILSFATASSLISLLTTAKPITAQPGSEKTYSERVIEKRP